MQNIKQPIRTTIRYTWLDLLDWLDRQNNTLVGLLLASVIIVGMVGLVGRIRTAPGAVASAPTPGLPIVVIQKEPAAVAPIAAPAQQVVYQQPAQRWITAWASPGGDVLGPIPEPLTSALLGRWGDGWVATTWQGNTVWLRAADLGLNLANLAPAIAPQQPAPPAYVSAPSAPQAPAVEQPAYQTDNQPAGPPAPPEQPQQAAPREVVPIIAPPAAPTIVPAAIEEAARPLKVDTEVERNWAVEQWRSEHCAGDECYP